MLNINNIIDSLTERQVKPDDEELRKLPDRKAEVKGRLSDFSQVKDHKESVLEIAEIVRVL